MMILNKYGDYAYDAWDECDDYAIDNNHDYGDDSCTFFSSDEGYDYNTNVMIDMHGNRFQIIEIDNAIPYDDDEKLTTIQAVQQQINTICAGWY